MKRKPKPTSFLLKSEVYPVYILVSIGNDNAALRKLAKSKLSLYGLEDADIIDGTEEGRALHYNGGRIILHLREHPITPFQKATLAHEVFHIVTYVMSFVGINLTRDSDEAFAYMTSWLTEAIYKQLDK